VTKGRPGSSSTRYLIKRTYEEFALGYYILVPLSSRILEVCDMADKILTRVLGVIKSEGLDKY
jgi:myosin-5